MKTIRFGDLVRNSGRPRTLTVWSTPGRSPELQKAIRARRVLTVHQENVGTKRDFGVIGFHPDPLASYLVFPRRLSARPGEKVIGINYALLDEEIEGKH
jgi:hypothetical protein